MTYREELMEKIRNNCIGSDFVTEDSYFSEIGIESLALIEIIVETEEKYNFCFDDEQENIYQWNQVKDFLDAAQKYIIK